MARTGRPPKYHEFLKSIIDLSAENYSVRQIGLILDIPKSTVARMLKKHG
jgi:transposase-like protein